MKFTIEQLKYADEVCFPDDFERLLKKFLPDQDLWGHHFQKWIWDCKRSLPAWIFSFSRADLDRGMGEAIDNMLAELIGDYE